MSAAVLCTACGSDADHLRPAHVFLGPGDLRPGQVCDDCAALGWLLVMGPDVFDAPSIAEQLVAQKRGRDRAREKPAPKEREPKRQRRAPAPKHEPLPLPKSARDTLLWEPGLARKLWRGRYERVGVTPPPALPPDSPPPVRRAEQIATAAAPPAPQNGWDPVEEEQYQRWKARLVAELREEAPALLKVLATSPELEVTVEHETIEAGGKSLRGRIGRLIAEDFFDTAKTQGSVRYELKRTGPDVNPGSLSREINSLVALGFLTREGSGGYRMAPGAKVYLKHTG